MLNNNEIFQYQASSLLLILHFGCPNHLLKWSENAREFYYSIFPWEFGSKYRWKEKVILKSSNIYWFMILFIARCNLVKGSSCLCLYSCPPHMVPVSGGQAERFHPCHHPRTCRNRLSALALSHKSTSTCVLSFFSIPFSDILLLESAGWWSLFWMTSPLRLSQGAQAV